MRSLLTILPAGLLLACAPPPPAEFAGFDGVSAKAVTVILGAPVVDENWDAANGPTTWRRELRERYDAPRRVFYKGRWILDGFTSHEFLISCDLTAVVRDGRVTQATLSGAPRACDAIRADAVRVAALIDVLQEETSGEVVE